jgi:3-aminobutyryl-CoA ammonia-lyase
LFAEVQTEKGKRFMPDDISQWPERLRKTSLTLRVPEELAADSHGFMGGWWAVRVAADVLTMLTIQLDSDESLLRRWEWVDFFVPIYSGEYLRFTGELIAVGNTSRTIDIIGERLTIRGEGGQAEALATPEKVFAARAIAVTPKERQRKALPGT